MWVTKGKLVGIDTHVRKYKCLPLPFSLLQACAGRLQTNHSLLHLCGHIDVGWTDAFVVGMVVELRQWVC